MQETAAKWAEAHDGKADSDKGLYGRCKAGKKLQPPGAPDAVTIAVFSRMLFDMAQENGIYEQEGLESYVAFQQEQEEQPLLPGVAFPFVKALMTVSARLHYLYPESDKMFDIILVTNSHAQVGVRLINSINYYDLTIEWFCMTDGEGPVRYLMAYMTDLYLSRDSKKVRKAIEAGIAAATMFTLESENEVSDSQLRVAFDGDAVLFSDKSEIIVKRLGLDSFFEHEKQFENKPLAQVVLKTLHSLGLEVDKALFLAGAPKGPLLQKIRPHIFFDNQTFHIEGEAQRLGTIATHVPYGIGQKFHRGKALQPSSLDH